jgi:hypothetical protein
MMIPASTLISIRFVEMVRMLSLKANKLPPESLPVVCKDVFVDKIPGCPDFVVNAKTVAKDPPASKITMVRTFNPLFIAFGISPIFAGDIDLGRLNA